MSIQNVSNIASSIAVKAQQPLIAVQASDVIDSSVKVLMTNEKGLLGRIVEYVRSVFGSVTPGSLTDLCRSTDQVVKNVLAKLDFTTSADVFLSSLSKRAEVLNLNLDKETTARVTAKLVKDAFAGKSVEPSIMDAVIKYVGPSVTQDPAPVCKTWTRRTLEVVTVSALLAGAAGGYAYWAGYNVSMLNVSAFKDVNVMDSMSNAVAVSKAALTNKAVAIKDCVASYMPSLPSISMPSMPASLSNLAGYVWAPAKAADVVVEEFPGNTGFRAIGDVYV